MSEWIEVMKSSAISLIFAVKSPFQYSAIFCLCWFAVLVFLVDEVLKFQTLVDYFGSYALVEITLLLLVILPTIVVYRILGHVPGKSISLSFCKYG